MTDHVMIEPPAIGPADPRPRLAVIDDVVVVRGGRCRACRYPLTVVPPRCPVCGAGPVEPATFGPGATVFSSTVLRIPVPGRTPPYGLAYIDLDDGPRILVHVVDADGPPEHPLAPGSRVALAGWTQLGDPAARPTPSPEEPS